MSKKETLEEVKDLSYWKANAEEDYMKVPISVLRYISELEERSYSEEEVNKMFDTLKRNSIDNVAIIHNVDLFISSWKQEFKKK